MLISSSPNVSMKSLMSASVTPHVCSSSTLDVAPFIVRKFCRRVSLLAKAKDKDDSPDYRHTQHSHKNLHTTNHKSYLILVVNLRSFVEQELCELEVLVCGR